MTSIERTAYPQFKRLTSARVLHVFFTPTPRQHGALERAAARRGPRDAAIIAVLLYTGARAADCARLEVQDVPVTARTGAARLIGKGDQVRTVPLPAPARARLSDWLACRGRQPGPLWTGQRGPLSVSGLTQAVLAAGRDAGIDGLRPHRLRHTYATRLRQGGADPAHIQALLGHGSPGPAATSAPAQPRTPPSSNGSSVSDLVPGQGEEPGSGPAGR